MVKVAASKERIKPAVCCGYSQTLQDNSLGEKIRYLL